MPTGVVGVLVCWAFAAGSKCAVLRSQSLFGRLLRGLLSSRFLQNGEGKVRRVPNISHSSPPHPTTCPESVLEGTLIWEENRRVCVCV